MIQSYLNGFILLMYLGQISSAAGGSHAKICVYRDVFTRIVEEEDHYIRQSSVRTQANDNDVVDMIRDLRVSVDEFSDLRDRYIKNLHKLVDLFQNTLKEKTVASAPIHEIEKVVDDLQSLINEYVRLNNLNYRKYSEGFIIKSMSKQHWVDDRKKNIHYYSQDELKKYELHFKNGKVYDAENKLFDTGNKGIAIIVMDPVGKVHAYKFNTEEGRQYKLDLNRHSSFTRGMPLAFAGEIKVSQGEYTYLDMSSGHYLTVPEMLRQFVQEMRDLGVQIPPSVIHYTYK